MNTRIVPLQFSNTDDRDKIFANPPARYVRFGSFDLDLHRRELFRGGLPVALPRKVLQVLLVLIERSGDVVTREALRARLWPAELHVNYNANVNTSVNKLRQVLGDSANRPVYVETIPRKGYVFIAKIEYADMPGARITELESLTQMAAGSGRLSESVTSLLQTARRSPWLAIAIAGLLGIGILLGAITAYMALHPR